MKLQTKQQRRRGFPCTPTTNEKEVKIVVEVVIKVEK